MKGYNMTPEEFLSEYGVIERKTREQIENTIQLVVVDQGWGWQLLDGYTGEILLSKLRPLIKEE